MANEQTGDSNPRRLRADAARNRQLLIDAAEDLFRTHGLKVTLDDIARQAGVNVATAYRHFANREALVEAVLIERFTGLAALARELGDARAPDSALIAWLRAFVAGNSAYRGLALPIMESLHATGSPLATACAAMQEGGADLLHRAQLDGSLRPDLDMSTLLRLAAAVGLGAGGDTAEAGRLLDLLLDGVRRR